LFWSKQKGKLRTQFVKPCIAEQLSQVVQFILKRATSGTQAFTQGQPVSIRVCIMRKIYCQYEAKKTWLFPPLL